MNVWVAIFLTWSISGAALGDLKAYKSEDACKAAAARHSEKANTEPVTCEAFKLVYVEQTLIPAFQRSSWTREGQPVTQAFVESLKR